MTSLEQFQELYVRYRFQEQRLYYQRHRDEFADAQQQANLLAGLFMIAAGLASAAAAAGIVPKSLWVVLATTLPAVAGLGQALQRLYAYERVAKLYDDATRALTSVGPQPTFADPNHALAISSVAGYVTKIEKVFAKEQGQWGQLTAHLDAYTAEKRGGEGENG